MCSFKSRKSGRGSLSFDIRLEFDIGISSCLMCSFKSSSFILVGTGTPLFPNVNVVMDTCLCGSFLFVFEYVHSRVLSLVFLLRKCLGNGPCPSLKFILNFICYLTDKICSNKCWLILW